MNQRCKKRKKKRIGAHNYSRGLRTDLRGNKRRRRNIEGLSLSCFWCSSIKKKKKKQGWKRPLMWSTEEAKTTKTSANFWSMCKQQFVRTADLTALLPLLRPAEIDGRIDESDTACKARPESSAEILNLFISSGSAENFPFIVADVFLNSAVENVRGL